MDRQQGISVIELLVAILLISIGLLGLLSLQLNSIHSSQGSYQRSQATLLAEDLIERIRANPPRHNPTGYIPTETTLDYRNLYASFTSTDLNCSNQPSPNCSASILSDGENCDPFEMAQYDFFVSFCGIPTTATTTTGGINDLLTNGELRVNCIDDMTDALCAPGSLHEVVVSWNEQNKQQSNGYEARTVAITF